MKNKDFKDKRRKSSYDTLIEAFGFEEDTISLEDIERMFNEELKKPVNEIDFDLIHECILTIDFLKNKED